MNYIQIEDAIEDNQIIIDRLETSPIDIIFSFDTLGQNKFFKNYFSFNPMINYLLSSISNIDKSNINLNGSNMKNIYGNIKEITKIIITNYKQNFLIQIMKSLGSIDLIGNPRNLFRHIGTGVEDFFTKPINGIIKGPLEGMQGVFDGGYSLFTHTVGGTFSTAGQISSNISKGLLSFTEDSYITQTKHHSSNKKKPKNLLEGVSQGIQSVAGGIYSGVSDAVYKPLEGVKNSSFKQ